MGVWHDLEEIKALWKCDITFEPDMDEACRTGLLKGWHKAIGRCREWVDQSE
ncbi:hypothetical protein LJC20_02435 [Eubacteriales bacterium OttesenSCG-928-M02]|nr:hypothetical protein [Eubacteriales bacterium OttesenSCG-928-M02]